MTAPASPQLPATRGSEIAFILKKAFISACVALILFSLMIGIRTLPNEAAKKSRDYSDLIPPYFTREAMQWLVEKRIEHLVVDVPSVDRSHDEGRLVGHRLFFGLPPGSQARGDAARSRATITELAFIPDEVPDGPCILSLAVPALGGDAVPSQPIVYPLAP